MAGRAAALADWSGRRPLLATLGAALTVRVAVVVALQLTSAGTLFPDDGAYIGMGRLLARGDPPGPWAPFYEATKAFLLPLSWIYRATGSSVLAGQLFVAVLGAATAVLTTALCLRVLPPRRAVFAGLIVALLPSQVLWSSLTLKDAAVWALLAALAVVVATANDGRGRLPLLLAAAVGLLVGLAYLRHHTLVVAGWSTAVAAWLGATRGRLARGLGGVVMALVLPALLGLGIGGIDVVTGAGPLSQRRARNAVGAETALVPADPPETPPAVAGARPVGLGPDLAYLPRGLTAMLLRPLPWEATSNARLRMAGLENLVWYPVLALAAVGLAQAWRHRAVVAFPVLAGGGMLVTYSLAEGNFGTAYRHRSEFVWAAAVLAAVGAQALGKARSSRGQTPPAVADAATGA